MKNISLQSLIKFHVINFTVLGLVLGVIYAFGGFLVDTMVSLEWLSGEVFSTPGLSSGTALAFGALIGMPLIGACCGIFLYFIEVAIYFLFVKRIPFLKKIYDKLVGCLEI